MQIIRKHTLDGENLLKNEEEIVQLAAKFHHERIDGEGYPNRVKGEKLPEIVRIISIADIYTALISSREYRDAKDPQEVIAYLMQMSSKQVDTNIVKKLLENTLKSRMMNECIAKTKYSATSMPIIAHVFLSFKNDCGMCSPPP